MSFVEPTLILFQLIEIGAFDLVVAEFRIERDPPTVVLFEQFVRVFDVSVRHAPRFGEQIDVRERRRRLGRNDARDGREIDGHFIEHEDFVKADLDMLIKLRDDVDAPKPVREIERQILLLFRDVALCDAR